MSVAVLKRKSASQPQRSLKRKMFHATMLVTRAEEWCIEADSADEARALLATGEGHRCHLGDCLQVEVGRLIGDD
jgi:hypothetical protein